MEADIKNIVDQELVKGNSYYTDHLMIAVADRALKISRAFYLVLESNNIQMALTIARSQIDNIARFHGINLFTGREYEYVETFLKPGMKLNQLRHGKEKLTDSYLVRKLEEKFPVIQKVYEDVCGYCHLSEKHWLQCMTLIKTHQNEVEMVFSISEYDQNSDPDFNQKIYDSYIKILQFLKGELLQYLPKRKGFNQKYEIKTMQT